MSIVVVTGSSGLIGSEASCYFINKGFDVLGIDNDMRKVFFGVGATTQWKKVQMQNAYKKKYRHFDLDIRDADGINKIFSRYNGEIALVIHAAAQPSHDWAASNPQMDFTINANGTLNMLNATKDFAPYAPFIFTSTNKVYGDRPNQLPLVENELRWEIDSDHTYSNGIREDMSIDQTLHSLFGASKISADILVQEYGRYFGLSTVCFRGGCLTGPSHSGTELHGFLSYLMKCTITGSEYSVYGYKGKQVRDNIHSADLVSAFYEYFKNPRVSEVYNIGGGRASNCSMLEAIDMCDKIANRKLKWSYSEENRVGDHIWWISDISKFKNHYPEWRLTYNVFSILKDIYEQNVERWLKE